MRTGLCLVALCRYTRCAPAPRTGVCTVSLPNAPLVRPRFSEWPLLSVGHLGEVTRRARQVPARLLRTARLLHLLLRRFLLFLFGVVGDNTLLGLPHHQGEEEEDE